jgi:hypothetical protein
MFVKDPNISETNKTITNSVSADPGVANAPVMASAMIYPHGTASGST